MGIRHFTQRSIDSFKTTKTQEDIWDSASKTRGVDFGIRLSKSGSKEYICRYRDRMNKRRRLSIGNATTIGLREAYEKVREIASRLDRGLDPADERDAYKEAITFGALCDEYLAQHARYKKDGGKEDERIITRDLLPAWKSCKARDIRRRDIIALLDSIAHGRGARTMANRTRALVSKIFNFGIERELVELTPCVGLPRKNKENPKVRFLSDNEIKFLWHVLDRESFIPASMARMILLTGQRPGEVAGARWSEFHDNVWTIPAERVKNGRTHRVPISAQVVELVNLVRQFTRKHDIPSGDEFVFPSNRNESMSMHALQNLTLRLSRNKAIKEIAHFTPHDLRRTCATGMRRVGVTRETVARILNHTPKSVTLVYDRYDEMPEMLVAVNAWGSRVQALADCSTEVSSECINQRAANCCEAQADATKSLLCQTGL